MRATTIRHQATGVVALLMALVAAAPASAQGERCQAPPGRSALEQYCEQLPGAGGSQGGTGGGGSVDGGTARELRGAGEEGEALLGLAEGSGGGADDSDRGASGRSGGGGGAGDASGSGSSDSGAAGDAEDEPSSSVLSALASSAEDGPTVGDALAWVLIAIAVGCLALVWLGWRRRRADQPDSSA